MKISEITIGQMEVLSKMLRTALPELDTVLLIAEDKACRIVSNINATEVKEVLQKTLQSMDRPKSKVENGAVSLECRVKLTLEPVAGQKGLQVSGVKLLCPFPKDAQPPLLDEDAQMTLLGTQIASDALVHALASNLHYAHQKKLWDSAHHLRYCIRLLEDLFVNQADIVTSHGMKNY